MLLPLFWTFGNLALPLSLLIFIGVENEGEEIAKENESKIEIVEKRKTALTIKLRVTFRETFKNFVAASEQKFPLFNLLTKMTFSQNNLRIYRTKRMFENRTVISHLVFFSEFSEFFWKSSYGNKNR